MRRTLVILAVGLTPRHLGPLTPNLAALASAGEVRPLSSIVPAVTCSVQSTFLTGLTPREHGVVGNGWLFRDLMEVWFWRQSNRLVSGEKVWDTARKRDPQFTCANMFWWYNMGGGQDFGATPRPIYKADGRKLPDCYTKPSELRGELTDRFGTFPLFRFWGPATSIESSKWIADATTHVMRTRKPTLTLTYLPHLDYDLQRHGSDASHPAVAGSLQELDRVVGDLLVAADREGARVIVLSEYGIVPVHRPVHVNRALRQAGLLAVRQEDGSELLDPYASRAFAVADHQIAHVYAADPPAMAEARLVLESLSGVGAVLGRSEQRSIDLDHPRSGDLVLLAEEDAWFTYYYWLDDVCAPDFARTVEIHRKPGYDPVELFLDPQIRFPKAAIASRLARKAVGFRTLMDLIPLDASLVRGSHGLAPADAADGPLVIASEPGVLPEHPVAAPEVKQIVLDAMFEERRGRPRAVQTIHERNPT